MENLDNLENDLRLYSTSKIEDLKPEKIAFVIDLYEEVRNEDFLSINGDMKLSRLEVIVNEILNFSKLKDYFSTNTEYGLYTYTSNLKKEIPFCQITQFLQKLNEFKLRFVSLNFISGDSPFDLADIFNEAYSFMTSILSIESFAKNNKDNDYLIRFILFYNRSDIPATLSNTTDYNLLTFTRNLRFFFDVIFLRRKKQNEEDKKKLTITYSSFAQTRPNFWYIFENSGNLQHFKFYMNLLLANPAQRVKLHNIDKYHKKIANLINNFSE
jgi:hypothetical protein